MRAINAKKRGMLIVTLMILTGISVVWACLLWLMIGEGAGKFAMPFESWGKKLMAWGEK